MFLGDDAAAGGPFALLGIKHETSQPPVVSAALHRRLAQIDSHPLRLTPEADELRLALHAAAAQVMNPALHAELVRHWPEGTPAPLPAAWRTHLSAVSDKLVGRARLIVGASGGWNPKARTRLAHLARIHRVSAPDLIRALRPETPPVRRSGAIRRAVIEIVPPGSTGKLWAGMHAVLGVMLLALLLLLAVELSAERTPPVQAVADPPTAPSGAPARTESTRSVPGPRRDLDHHTLIEQELRNALALGPTQPTDAATRAARAIGVFLRSWTAMPGEARERIAAQSARILITVVPSEEAVSIVLDTVMARREASDPAEYAAAEALAAWWQAWPDLPRSVRDQIPAATADPVTGRFDAVLASALNDWVRGGLSKDASDWARWSEALTACNGAHRSARIQSRLAALETMLSPSSPLSGPSLSRAMESVAGGLSWRSGEPSRSWLIEQLEEPSIPSDRLAVLTDVLATRLSVPGVDPSMVLASGAGEEARLSLSSSYRAAWVAMSGVDAAVREEVLSGLTAALGRGPGGTEKDRLSTLLALARANAAAAALFMDDPATAADLLIVPPDRSGPGQTPQQGSSPLDEVWASSLLAMDNPEQIMQALRQVRGVRGRIDPAAAEAILLQATQGSGRELRELARDIVVSSSWNEQILLAVERAAIRRPSVAVGRLVTEISGASMPPATDPGWHHAVRSALLPLIVERISADQPGDLVYAELELAELALRRAGGSGEKPLLASLVAETDAWLRRNSLPESDRLSTRAIEARRTARADGIRASTQLTAIQHRAMVEAVGATMAAQGIRPRSSVDREMEHLAKSWADAERVTDQLIASFQTEARLWRSLLEGSL